MATLSGAEGRKSVEDMKPSSSASQSEMTEEQDGDVSLDGVTKYSIGGFSLLDFLIALRRYLIRFYPFFLLV
jgi:hypothetical protein